MQTLNTSASSQATILPGPSSLILGLGPVTSVTAGMNTGIRHGTRGGGTVSASSNINANSNLVSNQLGPSDAHLQSWMGQIRVSGASTPHIWAGHPRPTSISQHRFQTGTIASATTQTQRPEGASKYTKLWEVVSIFMWKFQL
jgi:hypothetical protein